MGTFVMNKKKKNVIFAIFLYYYIYSENLLIFRKKTAVKLIIR